jgi:hypothetical protein
MEAKSPQGPTRVVTVDGDQFQVRGEERIYDTPEEAMERSRQLGGGSVVIRLSDRKVIASVPGVVPPPPKEWT